MMEEVNPEEEQIVVEEEVVTEEGGEQVLGIIDIHNPEDATLILQQDGLDLNGQHIYIGQDGLNGDYFVVVHDALPEDSEAVAIEHKDDSNPLQVDDLKAESFSHAIGNQESVFVEQVNLGSNSDRMGSVRYHASLREDNEGIIYFPTSSDSSTDDSPAPTGKHERLLQLASVAQELHSVGESSGNSQNIQDFQCSQSIPEGSVIVSQNHADNDSAYRASETEVSSSTDLASEHESQCGIAGPSTPCNVEDEVPTNERRTSFSSISSTRNIDNTVSVIHTTTSSTYAPDDLEEEPESSNLANDSSKSDKSEDSVHTPDNCSNPDGNITNQEDDSVPSQSSGLDLTKESTVDNPVCDEDSFPPIGHSRGRYGIMDSLNKDKRNACYDTNTSEEVEDTVNSTSPSTNVTDDIQSPSEHNSNQCNNEDVGFVNNVSSEPLSPKNGNLNEEKSPSAVIEACDGSDHESSQDSKKHNRKKHSAGSLLSKRKLRSSHSSSNDNSNSKCYDLPEKEPSLSDLGAVKKSLQSKINTKKVMDAYEFEDGSSNAEIHTNPSLERKNLEEGIESVKEGTASKLTFREAFSSVLEREKIEKTYNDFDTSDHSAELFEDAEEKNELHENEEVPDDYKNGDLEQGSSTENTSVEKLNSQTSLIEQCSNEQKSLLDEIENEKSTNTPSLKTINGVNENSLKPPKKVNTRKQKVVTDLVDSPIKMYTRKRKEEEDMVKPPTKTYIRKRKVENEEKMEIDQDKPEVDAGKIINDKDKIELFSCDDLSSTKDSKNSLNIDSQKDLGTSLVNVFEMDDDDLESNVQSKVSATYKRKPKNVPPVVRANRTRSLRPRSSKVNDSEEVNEAVDSSLHGLGGHLNSQDKEDDANWGDILMRTQFTSEPNPAEDPVPSSSDPNTSSPSRKRKRPAWFTTQNSNKTQLASGKQFDKLIKSSPLKAKSHTTNEKKKLRDKIKKQAMSLCNNLPSTHKVSKRGRPKKPRETNKEISVASTTDSSKRCKITILCENPGSEPSLVSNETDSREQYYCVNKCGFVSTYINNLIFHMKYCSIELDSSDLDSSDLLCDMDKRQRIRGETKNKEKDWNGPSTSSDVQNFQPSSSRTYEKKRSKKEKIDKTDAEKRYGFAERDIVWIKRGRQHWPALVWEIRKQDALFYVITSPTENEPLTLKLDQFKKNVHPFDDVDWSKKMLGRSQNTNKNSNFLKAVQKANSYIGKKVLSESKFDAKKFFDIKDETTKPTESSGSEMDSERPYSSPTPVMDNEIIDIAKLLECIFRGDCDDHVISVYNETSPSERNKMFYSEDKEDKRHLEDRSWFGPFKSDSEMQLKLYDHFYELFKSNVAGGLDASYIYKVWIPEGIIKAIALVNKIPFDEAETVFLSQENQNDLSFDPLEGTSTNLMDGNSSSNEYLENMSESAPSPPEASSSSP